MEDTPRPPRAPRPLAAAMLLLALLAACPLTATAAHGWHLRKETEVRADLATLGPQPESRGPRAELLIELAGILQTTDPAAALLSAREAAKTATDLRDQSLLLRATLRVGDIIAAKGDYNEARDTYLAALELARQIKDEPAQAEAQTGVGTAYFRQSRYNEALPFFHNAETLAHANDRDDLLAAALNGLGRVASRQGRSDDALELLLRARSLYTTADDTKGVAQATSDIGGVYQGMGNDALALEHYTTSLNLRKSIGDTYGALIAANNAGWASICLGRDEAALVILNEALASARVIQARGIEPVILNNIGIALEHLKRYDEAIARQNEAMALALETGGGETIIWCHQALASVLRAQGKLSEAAEEGRLALELANKLGVKDLTKRVNEFLSSLAEQRGDLAAALSHYKAAAAAKDEILSDERTRKVTELEARYEAERKSREITQLEMERSTQQLELRRQTLWRNSATVGLLLVIALAAVLYNRFRVKRNSEALLQAQNTILEERGAAVLASITYARTIQQALLPATDRYRETFGPGNTLLLYRPKDIVSGDFHWLHRKDDGTILLAVCDCTGHGVPGAFMSVIGHDLLNQTVIAQGLDDPAEILAGLHTGTRRMLGQADEAKAIQDGMDIALVRVSPDRRQATFAGARRPLWIERPGQPLDEIKGDKFSIGGRHRPGEIIRAFQSHTLHTPPGTVLHLATDGFADQSDPERRSFGSRRLRDLLASLASPAPLTQRRPPLENALRDHQKHEDQRDDITLLIVRLA